MFPEPETLRFSQQTGVFYEFCDIFQSKPLRSLLRSIKDLTVLSATAEQVSLKQLFESTIQACLVDGFEQDIEAKKSLCQAFPSFSESKGGSARVLLKRCYGNIRIKKYLFLFFAILLFYIHCTALILLLSKQFLYVSQMYIFNY